MNALPAVQSYFYNLRYSSQRWRNVSGYEYVQEGCCAELYARLDEFCDLAFYRFVVQACLVLNSHDLGGNCFCADHSMAPSSPFRTLVRSQSAAEPRGKRLSQPYLAQTFGCTSSASLIMMGVCGLCFFIVGYVRSRNCLILCSVEVLRIQSPNSYRAAALCSDV
jgi:hypothetical protein